MIYMAGKKNKTWAIDEYVVDALEKFATYSGMERQEIVQAAIWGFISLDAVGREAVVNLMRARAGLPEMPPMNPKRVAAAKKKVLNSMRSRKKG